MADSHVAPRKAPRQERSRRTVDRILAAAAVVFDEAGYAGATTNDIAREAGISIGSLYQYFPHKDALLVELAHRHVNAVTAALGEFRSSTAPESLELDALLSDLVNVLVAQHELDHLHTIIAHQAPRTTDLDRELARAREGFIDMADEVLSTRIPDPGNRRVAASMVVAILDATVHQVLLCQSPGPQRDIAVALMLAAVSAVIESAASTISD